MSRVLTQRPGLILPLRPPGLPFEELTPRSPPQTVTDPDDAQQVSA